MAFLELDNLTKVFPGDIRAVDGLDIELAEGEFLVLVGPSGCGKSTVLRMIAGLESTTEGEIRLKGEVVNDREPRERDVAMVFQNYALYPHMSVRDNLLFPLKMVQLDQEAREKRVEEVADTLGLTQFLKQKPGNLSGGQRQRVAMGRAMVREPDLFLLDEPLSNLDAELRMQIRTEIARLQSELGTTTIYVTHDQVEAMTLGDRVAVLSDGKLRQIGPGQELYDHPANTFVAGFIGTPGMNLFRTKLQNQASGRVTVKFGDIQLSVPEDESEKLKREEFHGESLIAGVRPEAFSYAADGEEEQLSVEVIAVEALGHELLVYFQSPEPTVRHDSKAEQDDASQEVGPSMVARLSSQKIPEVGERVSLSLDTSRVRLFDSEGNSLSQT